MNGDIGKLPPGAGYPATHDSLVAIGAPSLDYSVMNGGLMLDTGVGPLEPLPQLAMDMGGAVGYTPIEMAPLNEISVPPTQMGEHAIPNIPLDQLKQMLSSQLEYYFSRENLANDAYLLSQMDNDQYVPIWTVANFNQVKKLTKDIKLITEVLRESPNVQVDEEGQKVRPNHKRCIVILREIPDNTPIEDVKNLFSGEGCPRFISCEFAHNSSWYVTFESDEDAQRAYRFLREEVREFQGKPIMARIKAKPMNRLPIPTAVTNVGGMKNGYRTPPPPPVFDHNTYQPGQQRLIYTNGTHALPQTAMPPYPNPVHVYHPPFYPPGMVPAGWGTSPTFYDMSSVYAVNGIASHNSFKPHNTRYNQRNNNTYSRNKQRNGSERSGLIDGGGNMVPMARTSHPPLSGSHVPLGVPPPPQAIQNILPTVKPAGTKYQSSHTVHVVGELVHSNPHTTRGSQENESHPQQDTTTQYSRHRVHRRTKDQETLTKSNSTNNSNSNPLPSIRETSSSSNNTSNNNNTQHNRGVQFDLEAAAFPPLPGLDVNASKSHNSCSESSTNPDNTQSQNRLSDVVKGTAKLKGTNKDRDQQQVLPTQQQTQQLTGNVSSPPQYHHHQYQQQSHQHQLQHHQHHHHQQPHQQHNHPHHHHHQPHHHHHQQQQQQHHHHHHHYQSSPSSTSSSSVATVATVSSHSSRSTSPGNQLQQQTQHHRRTSPESVANGAAVAAIVATTSSTLSASSNSNANSSADSEIAVGTVTLLTPPTSPDNADRTNKTDVANGVDEAGQNTSTAAASPSAVVVTSTTIATSTAAVAAALATTAATTTTASEEEKVSDSVSSRCDCVSSSPSSSQNAQSHTGGVVLAGSTDITRPSYAQVAQHSRELSCAKHKADEKDGGST